MFIPPHARTLNSLIRIIPSKPSGSIFQFHEHGVSFFMLSNLFFNCDLTSFNPVLARSLSSRFFQLVLVKQPFGLFPRISSSLQISMKCFKVALSHTAFSAITNVRTAINYFFIHKQSMYYSKC
jgi:hypothetical protein